MQKNEIVTLRITDFTQEGLGVGRAGNMAVFVKDTIIGDSVRAQITKVQKTYAYARVLEILEESEDRIAAPCPVARPCGGCQIQMMRYAAQLHYKEEKVKSCLLRIGGFSEELLAKDVMEPIMGMEEPERYRNKAQFPVGRNKEGKLTAGFYAGRTHSIIDCRDCLIGIRENREIVETVLRHMETYHVEPYDETSGTGCVRHIMTRKGFSTGQIMVVLVLNAKTIPAEEDLARELWKIQGMTSLAINTNTQNTNVIFGSRTRTVRGTAYIEDTIGDIRFRIAARSFFQVNPVQTKKLYEAALEFAGLTGKETVWDLYCGIGTISLFLAQRAGQVYGVEVIPEAIENARENAALNGITNACFFVGKAEEVLPEKYETEKIKADVIVVDPPRKGCDNAVLDTMIAMAPQRIVYVSCDPATLARDLRYLCKNGYRLRKVKPCDMFPHTVHVETVVLMSRKDT